MATKIKKPEKFQLIKQKKRHPLEYDINANLPLVNEFLLRICSSEATKDIINSGPSFPENKGKTFFALTTFYNLMLHHEDFRKMYYKAKAVGAEMDAEEMRKLSDNCNGKSSAEVQKARLQVDTRKFLAMKLLPKIYGDKVEVDQTIKKEENIDSNQMNEVIEKIRKEFMSK
jgi:hypothetical protein